jgi:hypothetical protein
MQLTAVVDARDGGAEFRDLELPRESTGLAAGLPPVLTTSPTQALAVTLLESAEGEDDVSDPHPVERARLVVVLAGEFEIDTGAERRRFAAGDLLLAADTDGRGHVVRMLQRPVKCAFVALDRDAVARLLARR